MDEIELLDRHSQHQVSIKLSIEFLANPNPSSGKLYTATFIKWGPTVAVIGP